MAKPTTKHNRDILRIDELVLAYKNGNVHERNDALTDLINQFGGYFNKYVDILHGGALNLHNRDTYRFLSLFLPKQEKTTQSITWVRRSIVRIMQHYERGDIYNELVLIFINLLNKYKRVENEQGVVNFVHYFTTVFRFRVKDWYNSLTGQPLLSNPVYIDEGLEDSDGNLLPFLADGLITGIGYEFDVSELDRRLDLKRLDMAWVARSSDPLFRDCSQYDRYLLYNCFGLGKSVQSIADMLGRDKDTIWRHLHRIMDNLRRCIDANAEGEASRSSAI